MMPPTPVRTMSTQALVNMLRTMPHCQRAAWGVRAREQAKRTCKASCRLEKGRRASARMRSPGARSSVSRPGCAPALRVRRACFSGCGSSSSSSGSGVGGGRGLPAPLPRRGGGASSTSSSYSEGGGRGFFERRGGGALSSSSSSSSRAARRGISLQPQPQVAAAGWGARWRQSYGVREVEEAQHPQGLLSPASAAQRHSASVSRAVRRATLPQSVAPRADGGEERALRVAWSRQERVG